MKSPKTYTALGLMSGSSLDGLDMALCRITIHERAPLTFDWELLAAQTAPYTEQWQRRLFHLPDQDALTYAKTHTYFGRYMAELVMEFLDEQKSSVDFIASHGHTIFHRPEAWMTTQIGDGAALAALTGITTITDFRTADVALGGEGAPLAPVADKWLFPGYDLYLNLGGIANLTFIGKEKVIAFDLAPCNQVLNALAQAAGLPYDEGGQMAAQGHINSGLLEALNALPYFSKPYPKTISNEWIQEVVLSVYEQASSPIPDLLRTACKHLALQLDRGIRMIMERETVSTRPFRMLVTGGGAYNDFLVQTIRHQLQNSPGIQFELPEAQVIDFKEAVLMAFLGVLRMEGLPNSFASVTGADRDTINGSIFTSG